MKSASSSEIAYGSNPNAPAASQKARSSGSLRDTTTRDQRAATSLSLDPFTSKSLYHFLDEARQL